MEIVWRPRTLDPTVWNILCDSSAEPEWASTPSHSIITITIPANFASISRLIIQDVSSILIIMVTSYGLKVILGGYIIVILVSVRRDAGMVMVHRVLVVITCLTSWHSA